MIRIVSILLLSLLLYHTFRASVTLYFLEEFHLTAANTIEEDEFVLVKLPISLPYTNTWESSTSQEGLIQHEDQFYNITEQRYVNDTLYTTLKTNTSAREKFFSIIEEMNVLSENQAADTNTPTSSIIKLLNQLAKVYISSSFTLYNKNITELLANQFSNVLSAQLLLQAYPVNTPPPKLS